MLHLSGTGLGPTAGEFSAFYGHRTAPSVDTSVYSYTVNGDGREGSVINCQNVGVATPIDDSVASTRTKTGNPELDSAVSYCEHRKQLT